MSGKADSQNTNLLTAYKYVLVNEQVFFTLTIHWSYSRNTSNVHLKQLGHYDVIKQEITQCCVCFHGDLRVHTTFIKCYTKFER